ncbi:phosphonate metabolism protein (transferase hexapeptide repeat family) [Devosia subaequoris]|uniref:Phosphonate metabolism protein (Transferase hexapeptide repeat family) n=1 Tax=Devosia subaequoris TaxID=395930 RepID=A0A7W6NB11_9HYPH|nr:DapH/DapD/GlmU-related protein [Devosia subaequoris]MBB4052074.1 phosphonate metabolism protein (transferase hexapeptide repeat family) [Devosia subaequoris]MCP1210237.1 acetyltransferase [Devosia subaequoris]
MKRLSEVPLVHETARVNQSTLGRYTEIGAHCHVAYSSMGDYSYCVGGTQIAYSTIGKFSNIAAHVRIYASMHPMERASLHHFTYRSAQYFEGESDDAAFFEWRSGNDIHIGHDTWIGHGAVIMPGVKIGNGAIVGANAVVTKDVADFAIAVGVPARTIRQRFSDDVASRLDALAWWDWDHERLRQALPDFRNLGIEAFLEKHEG